MMNLKDSLLNSRFESGSVSEIQRKFTEFLEAQLFKFRV